MGIDVDGMDMDMPVSMERSIYPGRDHQLGPAHLCEELQPSAPTPEKEKASSLKRFIMTRRAPDAPSPSRNQLLSTSPRPTISGPYALGTFNSLPRSTTSTFNPSKSTDIAQSGISLRPAPSLESFRSVQSTAAKSAHSVGSVRSTASTRGFRAWLERMGNAWSGT